MKVLSFSCCQQHCYWNNSPATSREPGSWSERWKKKKKTNQKKKSLLPTANLQRINRFSVLFKGEKWLFGFFFFLRMAALRLEIILIGIIISWFEFFGCCPSKAGKQICTPCNKLLTAMTLGKPKVWSLLAGVREFVCQRFPQLEERCS